MSWWGEGSGEVGVGVVMSSGFWSLPHILVAFHHTQGPYGLQAPGCEPQGGGPTALT